MKTKFVPLLFLFAFSLSASAGARFQASGKLFSTCEKKKVLSAIKVSFGRDLDIKKVTTFNEVNLFGFFKKNGKQKYEVLLTNGRKIEVEPVHFKYLGGSTTETVTYALSDHINGFSAVTDVTTKTIDFSPCTIVEADNGSEGIVNYIDGIEDVLELNINPVGSYYSDIDHINDSRKMAIKEIPESLNGEEETSMAIVK